MVSLGLMIKKSINKEETYAKVSKIKRLKIS